MCSSGKASPLSFKADECFAFAAGGSVLMKTFGSRLKVCYFSATRNCTGEAACFGPFDNNAPVPNPFASSRFKTRQSYIKFSWSTALAMSKFEELSFTGLTWYGNWCGGGHGGYQDCCNYDRCTHCDWHDGHSNVTRKCLAECPPLDALDSFCAQHDLCTFQFDKIRLAPDLSCYPQGNYCQCDCKLVESVSKMMCDTYACSIYSTELLQTFNYVTHCFYMDEREEQYVCNGYGGIALNLFC